MVSQETPSLKDFKMKSSLSSSGGSFFLALVLVIFNFFSPFFIFLVLYYLEKKRIKAIKYEKEREKREILTSWFIFTKRSVVFYLSIVFFIYFCFSLQFLFSSFSGEIIEKKKTELLYALESKEMPKDFSEKIMEMEEKKEDFTGSSKREEIIDHLKSFNFKTLPETEEEDLEIFLEKAEKIMDEKHYGLREVKEKILQHLCVSFKNEALKGKVICLVGPPGVGKTSLAASIAEAAGRKFERIDLSSKDAHGGIIGFESTYVGAQYGCILRALNNAQCFDPVILLDEIDKINNSGFSSRAATSALLNVLDTNENQHFVDSFFGESFRFDLSKVFFICTANYIERIPKELLNRMEVIHIDGYSKEEKEMILKTKIIPKKIKEFSFENILKSLEIKEDFFFPEEVIKQIVRLEAKESGIRKLEKKLEDCLYLLSYYFFKKKNSFLQDKTELANVLKEKLLTSLKMLEEKELELE